MRIGPLAGHRRFSLPLFGAAAILLAGCARKAPAPSTEQAYPLTGEVVSVDPKKCVAVVRHNEVKGYMPAMTMEFSVSPGDASVLRPGERIRAELDIQGSRLELNHIWPDDKVSLDTITAGARSLREDTNDRGKGAFREVGENVPDFVLYDQDGHVVQSSRFRGRQIMLNFIFSRCPIANMCPLSTQKMMQTQQLAKASGIKDIQFISITLDPAYDTPGVLKEYAQIRGIDTGNFSFLTGPEGAVKDLLIQFGVIAEFEGDLLKHTLATLLIDENGKIIWRADGSTWEPKEFVDKMKR